MKNVLVTGGTRGLGLAIVGRLLTDGYRVIAAGRRCSPELKALIDAESDSSLLTFCEIDLARHTELQATVRELVKTHGALYGLVNNAALGYDGVLATMHDSQIEELLRVNVLGSIVLTKYACRSMLLRREGRIVNIASIIAHTGFHGLSVYAATKAALVGFTKSLARELGKAGITVNTVSPGYMKTNMTAEIGADKLEMIRRRSPLGRLATVEDVANAVAYLLSDEARAVTGTDIVVDAGSTA